MTINNLDDLRVFLKVADVGGFSAAAKVLGVSPTTISKQISRLENKLGVKLFERNTRSVRISSEGRNIKSCIKYAISIIDEVSSVARDSEKEIKGVIRITAPVAIGTHFLSHKISFFKRMHPKVDFHLDLTDKLRDICINEYDMAFRVSSLINEKLVEKNIGMNRRILVASPEYIAQKGIPHHPSDLSKHFGLIFSDEEKKAIAWELINDNNICSVVPANYSSTNNGTVLNQWCLDGHGVSLREFWEVKDELLRGQLVRLLPMWESVSTPVKIVKKPSNFLIPNRIYEFEKFICKEWDKEMRKYYKSIGN